MQAGVQHRFKYWCSGAAFGPINKMQRRQRLSLLGGKCVRSPAIFHQNGALNWQVIQHLKHDERWKQGKVTLRRSTNDDLKRHTIPSLIGGLLTKTSRQHQISNV